MVPKSKRLPVGAGAGESAYLKRIAVDGTANSVHRQHGPVSVGLGYCVTFTRGATVDGVADLEVTWSPHVPGGRDVRPVIDRYSAELDKFLAELMLDIDGPVIGVEVSE